MCIVHIFVHFVSVLYVWVQDHACDVCRFFQCCSILYFFRHLGFTARQSSMMESKRAVTDATKTKCAIKTLTAEVKTICCAPCFGFLFICIKCTDSSFNPHMGRR